MKYFRVYPWGLQLILFLLLFVTMLGFGIVMIIAVLPKLTGFNYTQLETVTGQSPAAIIKAALLQQGFLSLFVFLVPAFLFAYLAHPEPRNYLNLKPAGKPIQWLLVVLVMLGAMPVLQLIQALIGMINFGDAVKKAQAVNEQTFNAFLTMPDAWSFIRVFIVLAIVPAVGEEMFFRGIMMRFAKKQTRTMAAPIIVTSIIFSYAHTNIYGYLSIFLAGALLAWIYYITGSLLCSMLAHVFFNGFQVILIYFGKSSTAIQSFLNETTMPVYYALGGAVLFAVSFYLLRKNKTPLPPAWTDDFPPDQKPDQWDFMAKS